MKRVVVTGMGIYSCIGQDLDTVVESLRHGVSGIVFDQQRIEYGMHCGLVGNVPPLDLKSYLPRRFRVAMSEEAGYAYIAAKQAFEQAKINDDYLKENEVGIIFGNDGNSNLVDSVHIMQEENNPLMLGPYFAFKTVTSSVNCGLSAIFHLRGSSFTTASACASSAHAIGIATMYIRGGMEKMILVGGAMEMRPDFLSSLDSLGATSLRNNDPTHASRPFDKDRDGMVPSGGAAALVLEEYEHAVARGATILAEVVGYGFSSNGTEEISMPSADAEYIAMKRSLDDAGLQPSDIDYINAHATSTIAGDIEEAKALTRLFGSKPFISSTKSMTGHENWMAGASEAVYSILMMQNNFVAPNINLENVIDEAKGLNIARETIYTPINTVLSNSSGMGGTNSALVFKKI